MPSLPFPIFACACCLFLQMSLGHAAEGVLITEFGHYPVLDADTYVDVSETYWSLNTEQVWNHAPDPNHPGQFFNGVARQSQGDPWHPVNGWFVYVGNNRYTWIYEGRKKLLIEFIPKAGEKIQPIRDFVRPPKIVMDHLPVDFRKKIASHRGP